MEHGDTKPSRLAVWDHSLLGKLQSRTRRKRKRVASKTRRTILNSQDRGATITCDQHGQQQETFVCQHIAASLVTHEPVGFFWPADAEEHRPDAWCSACNERVRDSGGEWSGEAAEHLGAKILCGACYDHAKYLNFGSDLDPPAA